MSIYSFTAMVPANVDIEADSEEEAREIMAEGVDWDVNLDNVDEFAELEDVEDLDDDEDEEDDEGEEADDPDEDSLESANSENSLLSDIDTTDEHQIGCWRVCSLEDEVRLKKRIDKDLLNEKVRQVNADLGWDCVQIEEDTLSIYGDNPETNKYTCRDLATIFSRLAEFVRSGQSVMTPVTDGYSNVTFNPRFWFVNGLVSMTSPRKR